MFRLIAIVASTATALASPSCYDDNGNAVDWFVAIKDNSGGAYALATSANTKMRQSSYDLQDGSKGGVSLTVQQLWLKNYSRGAYNDEPGFKASSKFGHTKGFVVADDSQAIWMIHR
jgi:hypothetical protein